jgi:uncharacterized membrane protein/protein-disulfide isomerase
MAKVSPRMPLPRILALVALTVSTLLLIDGLRPDRHLCAFDAGCGQVLDSPYGRPLGLPLPAVGAATFGGLLGLSLFPGRRTARAYRLLAVTAGAGGLGLLLVQALVIRRLCPYCAVVDAAAVLIAALEVVRGADPEPPPAGARSRSLWLAGTAAALGVAVLAGAVGGRGAGAPPAPAPPQVRALWVPGKLNVVEAADFGCPHCRQMHARLRLFLDEEGDRVHFVQVAAPRPVSPDGRAAARAYLCAARQGKGDALAEALFAARSLAPEACERIAADLGLSLDPFRACVADPASDARLDADLAWVRAASPEGLPVIWVQDQRLFGLQPLDALRQAARAAERQAGTPAP